MSLFNLRTFTLVITGFTGFLRFDELSDLKLGDVNFFPSYMKILIRKSKTDVYRGGDCVYIAKYKSEMCPKSYVFTLTKSLDSRSKRIFISIADINNLMMNISWENQMNKYHIRQHDQLCWMHFKKKKKIQKKKKKNLLEQ